MKSKFKMYVIVWAAVVVLFNVIVFITPNEVAGMSKFGGAFWVGYAFILRNLELDGMRLRMIWQRRFIIFHCCRLATAL